MEVILAIALFGALLATGVTLLFQVASFWSVQADDPVFDRHVDGLVRFLSAGLSRPATGTPAIASFEKPETLPPVKIHPAPDIAWFPLVADGDGRVEGLLDFKEGVGLQLLWRMGREKGTSRPLRKTVLSPWVTAASVLVYDVSKDEWRRADSREERSAVRDFRFLRLECEHRGQRRTLLIEIPDALPR